MTELQFTRDTPIDGGELNALFAAAWPGHRARDFAPALERSLSYFVVRHAGRLVGFLNLISDGGEHAFLIDPTVHPEFRRRGIGTRLLDEAAAAAQSSGCEWLHVDFVPELEPFYRKAGFQPTTAGLLHLPTARLV